MSHSYELADFVAKHPANWGITNWSGPSPSSRPIPFSAVLKVAEYVNLVLTVSSSKVDVEVYGRGGIMPYHGNWSGVQTPPDLLSRIGRRVADVVQNDYNPSLFGLPEWLRPLVRKVLLERAARLKAVAEET